MRLKWYGHASFGITAADGTHVVTDPYTPELAGYMPIPDAADVVVVSSDSDRFHCRADLVPGKHEVVNALTLAHGSGATVVRGIPMRAVEAMEALDHREHNPDQNGMYRLEVDGVHIGHMGDMGNALSAQQTAFFEGVDVLLALAGGHPTIALPDMKALIDAVQPSIVVPMHFRTLRYRPRKSFWISEFLSWFPDAMVDFPCTSEVEISAGSLPASTRVWVLTHAC